MPMAKNAFISQTTNCLFELDPSDAKSRSDMVIFGILFISLLDDDEHEWIVRTCRKAWDERIEHKPKPWKQFLPDDNIPKQVIWFTINLFVIVDLSHPFPLQEYNLVVIFVSTNKNGNNHLISHAEKKPWKKSRLYSQ